MCFFFFFLANLGDQGSVYTAPYTCIVGHTSCWSKRLTIIGRRKKRKRKVSGNHFSTSWLFFFSWFLQTWHFYLQPVSDKTPLFQVQCSGYKVHSLRWRWKPREKTFYQRVWVGAARAGSNLLCESKLTLHPNTTHSKSQLTQYIKKYKPVLQWAFVF